eukprot:scaffold1697_cov180-Amphora_coffeaeformis.AAC.36
MEVLRWKRYFILSVALGAAVMTLHSTLFGFDSYQQQVAFIATSRMEVREEIYITKPPRNYEDTGDPDPVFVPYSFIKENWRPSISPYEYRWPGERLARWARKREDTIIQHLPPDDKTVCFAHIGKTGGSSLGCSLGFSLHCPKNPAELYSPPGLLPLYTTNTVHNDVNDCPDNAPYYLFGLRDPLERVQSAYLYDRRSVEDQEDDDYGQYTLYVECPFYTLNDLALRGLAKNGNAPDFCKKRAYNAIRGNKRFGYHLYYNHEHFLKETNALDSKILVIRTSHMRDDWNSAEVALGGENNVADEFPHANKGEGRTRLFDDNHLSPRARELLCEALCEEIQWYKKIIENAVNLSPDDKVQSLREISCPVQARAKKCPRP